MQIKSGKHMKRSFEANTALYVALFCVYTESFASLQSIIIEKKLRERLVNAAVMTKDFTRKEKGVIRENHDNIMTVLDAINFFE